MLCRLVFLVVLILAFVNPSQATDVSLTITQKSLQDRVIIEILNTSPVDVIIDSVGIELNKKKYITFTQNTIKAGALKDFFFSIQPPQTHGSYVILSTVRYLNDGVLLTMKHADLYHNMEPSLLSQSCSLQATPSDDEGRILLAAPQTHPWKLLVPDEIETRLISVQGDIVIYQARSTTPGFTAVNRIFAAAETDTGHTHQAAICSAILTLNPGSRFHDKGWIPGFVYILLAIIFFALSTALMITDKQARFVHTTLRYGSRMFFLSLSCWILKEMDQWLVSTMNHLGWEPYQWFARILLDNIRGGNYQYFFHYFVDWYCVLCFVFVFPSLYVFNGHKPQSNDKYVASFRTFLTLPCLLVMKRHYWNNLAKLGFLTIMIKFFFTPIMVSWAIGSAYTMVNGFRSFQWNVHAVNAYLVQLLILVDTLIFSLGYLIESKYLKNEIKSVDPTFFGWLVCLWCYPPFNAFSFKPLDFYIVRISLPYPDWLNVVVLFAITCLWGVFVWASIALGFKASNLTNRGIIRSGPYKFVRHPAYMAKLLIWILQGVFFAQFGMIILLGFISIYVLRAWTEERHLSLDPDYLVYKQSVRWWFIPGVL